MIVRFLENQGLNCREILHRPPPKQSNTCLLKRKKEENPEGEPAPAPEKPSGVFVVLFINCHSVHAPSTAATFTGGVRRPGSNAEARKRQGVSLLTAIPQFLDKR